MPRRILILGTGGTCIDILETIRDINACGDAARYECVGFLDDDEQRWGREYHGVRVLGPLASAPEHGDCCFVNGIGSPFNFWKKSRIIAKTGLSEDCFETIIHPTAYVSPSASIGKGTVVLQNVTINSNVTIGKHVIVLPNSLLSHDDVIGDYTCVAGGVRVSGGVKVGQGCYLGTNCSLIGGVEIGEQCLIGMGSVVLKSVENDSVMVGNPAKFVRRTVEEDPMVTGKKTAVDNTAG